MSPIARSGQIHQILERHGQGLGPGAGFQTRPLTGRRDRDNDFRAGSLNVFKRFGEAILVPRIEKNVFAGGPNGFETNRLARRAAIEPSLGETQSSTVGLRNENIVKFWFVLNVWS